MTKDELRAQIQQNKVKAFDLIWSSRSMDPTIAGYKSHEDMVLKVVVATAKENEKLLREFERLHKE